MKVVVPLLLHLILPAIAIAQTTRPIEVRAIDAAVDAQTVEFRGLGASAFNPQLWQTGKPHLLPDLRSPMLEPLPGPFRNIYAPSAVQTPDGWRLFYGAWDGIQTGNDHIYSVDTPDFLTFNHRQMLIQPGAYQHICNVSAVALSVGSYAMLGTAYPDEKGLNKPAYFFSRDGKTWNDRPAPYTLNKQDIVSINGYDKYADADINGMNVMLYEDGKFRMYFGNFHDPGKTFRATSNDGVHYNFDAKVLDGNLAINDIKKFHVGKKDWYLMGLHMNGGQLCCAISDDPLHFPPARPLFDHLDPTEAYMVAIGFVVQGSQEFQGRRILGVLYGAGAKASLDANRIFARWLQKRVVFVTGDKHMEPTQSLGPNRQVLKVNAGTKLAGRFELYGDDGQTLLGSSDTVNIEAGHAYVLAIH